MTPPDLEALYGAVFAAPADDAPRLVLADALQERGDPRGEFISLQLQSPRPQRSERRMQKLLERHRSEFLRGLALAVMPDAERGREDWAAQRWERGFLSEATVMLHGQLVDTPDWATVRRLEVFGGPGTPPLELSSPHMRSLKEISRAGLEVVPVLFNADRPLGVESVTLQGPPELGAWPAAEVAAIGEASSLPGLSRLTLRCQTPNFPEARWLWRLPVLPRLRSLELMLSFRGVPVEPLLFHLREAERPPPAVVVHSAGLKLRLKRDDGFRSLVLELEQTWRAHTLDQLLASIAPDSFDELLVTSNGPVDAALLAQLRRGVRRLSLRRVTLPGPA